MGAISRDEECPAISGVTFRVHKEKPVIENGYLHLPDKPGFGVELADNLEERCPYIEGHYAVQLVR